ncbi:hypothetical protein UA08_06886 [Talaromyces atroroseus]|uniref:Uncharacterized protein n=1 Tax=Talaromyces atroroseus TaxID=1441469 RepID=A0A225AA95_TALAT|nr:hypothetical protein UA08_06886 [Talaromyces atroroseus]OKL57762.1 hypothetical protein UA08_06886 [Talaromyces atroroseus]
MIIGRVDGTPHLNRISFFTRDVDQLPANPVLSIMHFTFQSGVDIADQSHLASIPWRKSLKYVSTIPGFQGLYWAPVDQPSSCQQIIVLIQWDSGRGWRCFQRSLGFSMMLGYIENISNRCIQLALPVDSLFTSQSCLELVSFQFSEAPSTDQIAGLRSKWNDIFSSYLSNALVESRLIHFCGEWLEVDKDSEDRFFVGLLFWKHCQANNNQDRIQPSDPQNLEKNIEEIRKDATNVVSASTTPLNHIPFKISTLQSLGRQPLSVPEIEHPLFQTPTEPEYNLDEFVLSSGQDRLHVESMIEARRGERIAGGPAGTWLEMGLLSQHHLPQRLEYNASPNMEMISFRAPIGDPQVESSFEHLRKELWGLGNCPDLFWGRDKEMEDGQSNTNLLFIQIEESKYPRPEFQARVQKSFQSFADRCGKALQDISYRSIVSPIRWGVHQNMDITIFDVSKNEWDQRSFEIAFSNFREYVDNFSLQTERTTAQHQIQRQPYGPYNAFMPKGQGWVVRHQDSSFDIHEPETVRQFMSYFNCEKEEGARKEWYGDFAQRAQTEYELLGHIVDFMEKEDDWMIADKLKREEEKANKPPSPAPKSIFDLSWAKPPKKPDISFHVR